MTGSPRLTPLPVDQWTDSAVAALRGAFPDKLVDVIVKSGRAPNVLATMVHHPQLAGAFNVYGNVLLQNPTIGHRARELMILRVAWRTGAQYEWVHHALLGPKYGVSADDIEAITRGERLDSWTSLESDLVAATDQMLDNYRIADETWQRLSEQLSEQELVEVPMVVGTYTALAMAFNSWDLQVESNVDASNIPIPSRPVDDRPRGARLTSDHG